MQIGQYVELSNLESLVKNKELNGKYEPLRSKIERIGTIKNELAQIQIIYLNNNGLIVTLDVDGKTQTMIFYTDTDFPVVNRKTAIEQELFFLFCQPPETYEFNELEFTGEINDDDTHITYKKEWNVLGEYTETPDRSGLNDLFGGFALYNNGDKKLLALTEIGATVSDDGGLITINKGYEISTNDIKYI